MPIQRRAAPQNLHYRLVGRGWHFRAYLARGAFRRGRLENVDAFCGAALAGARRREREIQCTDLFIDDDVLPDCNVFLTTPYDPQCHFVPHESPHFLGLEKA